MRALKISLIFIFAIASALYAQDENKLVNLSRQIIEAKTSAGLYGPLEQIKEVYFKDNKYSDFIDFLKSLSAKKDIAGPFINYYIALTRYSQLRSLEEKQLWDEYFSKGNDYRDEVARLSQKAIDATTADDALNIYSRLLLWQFHKDQQDSSSEGALQGLMNSLLEYSKAANDAKLIKEAADKLYSYGEKGKAKELYKIYVDKIISSEIKDEALAESASGFYKEGNLDLSETLYDVYIERIAKSGGKEKLLPVLKELAKDFSYKEQGFKDPAYAEKLFKRMEESAGSDVFDEELMYMRAFNLEQSKEYPKAKEAYLALLKRYPGTQYANEANFKAAVIYTYILRDIKNARPIFEALAQKEGISPQALSSLYQLGLVSQWENDFVKAKEYYNKLLEKAGASFAQTTAMAKERLKEIEELRPMEYNLRVFLDLSLKEENKEFDMTKIALSAAPYKSNKEETVNIASMVYTATSGCMEIQLQYLWSEDLGAKQPIPLALPAFDTTYADKGTKIIGLVVVSPSGVVDRSMTMVDVN